MNPAYMLQGNCCFQFLPEAWDIIARLYEEGFAFQGCGCDISYIPPEKLHELPSWLSEYVRKSKGEKLLESIDAKK